MSRYLQTTESGNLTLFDEEARSSLISHVEKSLLELTVAALA